MKYPYLSQTDVIKLEPGSCKGQVTSSSLGAMTYQAVERQRSKSSSLKKETSR
jgi:hypothetical protein